MAIKFSLKKFKGRVALALKKNSAQFKEKTYDFSGLLVSPTYLILIKGERQNGERKLSFWKTTEFGGTQLVFQVSLNHLPLWKTRRRANRGSWELSVAKKSLKTVSGEVRLSVSVGYPVRLSVVRPIKKMGAFLLQPLHSTALQTWKIV